MYKATLFDIAEKKDAQVEAEMAMTPQERLLLCLDLMDMSIALSKGKSMPLKEDTIEWIELKFRNAQSDQGIPS